MLWWRSRSRRLTAVVCSDRNRPHSSKGQWASAASGNVCLVGGVIPSRRWGMIAVAGFPKLSSAFAASSLGVAEAGTDQLARIVEREPSPPFTA